ncbi:hypothetical protein KFE25_012527 [Diacronema lutheri]|uniref:Uncharacterized protein n=1 Tax=Diacronema lutheri TaxID=2081491 RepID=A0A8J5XL92_DIALT|nr:hypothetical protein KFE25_012527 [Diacronema lutheri]
MIMSHAELPMRGAAGEGAGAMRAKQRKRWSDDEHRKLLEGLRLYGRDWRRIQSHVGTRNAAQLRSHAQKYFVKVQREGTDEYIPPPQSRRTAISLSLTFPLTRGPAPAGAPNPPLTLASSLIRRANFDAGRRGAGAEPCSPSSDKVACPSPPRPRTPLSQLGSGEVHERLASSPRAFCAPAPSPLRPREPGVMPPRRFDPLANFTPPFPPNAHLLTTSASSPRPTLDPASSSGDSPPPGRASAGASPVSAAAAPSDFTAGTQPSLADASCAVPTPYPPAPACDLPCRGCTDDGRSRSYSSVDEARAAIVRLAGCSHTANLHMLSLVADTIDRGH